MGVRLLKIKRPSTRDLARMCAEGLTQAQIGRIYGVSHATVRTWIARNRVAFDQYFMAYHSKRMDKETERRERGSDNFPSLNRTIAPRSASSAFA